MRHTGCGSRRPPKASRRGRAPVAECRRQVAHLNTEGGKQGTLLQAMRDDDRRGRGEYSSDAGKLRDTRRARRRLTWLRQYATRKVNTQRLLPFRLTGIRKRKGSVSSGMHYSIPLVGTCSDVAPRRHHVKSGSAVSRTSMRVSLANPSASHSLNCQQPACVNRSNRVPPWDSI